MNEKVKLLKRLDDGRYLFSKEGVYFALTVSDVKDIIHLIKEQEDARSKELWGKGVDGLPKGHPWRLGK